MLPLDKLREILGPTAEGWSDEDLERVRGVLYLLAEEALEIVERGESAEFDAAVAAAKRRRVPEPA